MLYEFYRQKILAILAKVPEPISKYDYEDYIPIEREKPFNTLLQKEIVRFNLLIERIKTNLINTLAAIEGVGHHDRSVENTFECLQTETIP